MIEVTALKKKFKLTKDHKKNKMDDIDPREDKDYFHSVKNVSFSCAKGEVLGLLGPNGAGKTTTLRMISTALKPDDGSITIAIGATVLMGLPGQVQGAPSGSGVV